MSATEQALKKKPMGRPSKYKPEFCEEIIELGKKGKSIAQMAAHFDVDKASIYDWAEKHENFSTALARARAHSQAWWEDAAQNNMASREFNAHLWSKSVTSRFREDYTERQQTEITGANGGAVQIEAKTIDTSKLSAEELAAFRNLVVKLKGSS